jgi:preprotein translocase subunit SecE
MNDKVGKAAKLKSSGNQGGKDMVLWAVVLLLIIAAIYGNSYFATQSILYRTLGLVVLAAAACWIAAQTVKGKAFVTLCLEARTEIRKVVWPTRTETTQTTLIVVVVVMIVGLILWGVDSLLSWIISLIIG